MTRDRTHEMDAQMMMQLKTHFIVFYSFQTVHSCCLSLPFPPLEKFNLRKPWVILFWSRIDADLSLSHPSSPVPSTLSSVFCSTPLLAMRASVAKPSSGSCLPYVDVYVCTITHSCTKRLINLLGMHYAATRLSHVQRMSLVLYAARRVLNLNHCTHTRMNDLWLCVCVCVCVWNGTGNDLGDVWETDFDSLVPMWRRDISVLCISVARFIPKGTCNMERKYTIQMCFWFFLRIQRGISNVASWFFLVLYVVIRVQSVAHSHIKILKKKCKGALVPNVL